MKILLVQPFAHKAGHQPIFTKSLGEALIAHGQNVHVVTFDGFIVPVSSKLKVSSVCARENHHGSLNRIINKLFSLNKMLNLDSFFISFLTLGLALKKLSEEHFDIVHVIDSNPFPMAQLYFAGKAIGSRAVFNINFPLELSYLAEHYGAGLSKTYGRLYSLNKARAIIWLLSSRIFGSRCAIDLYEKWGKGLTENEPFFVCHTQYNKDSYSETMLRNIVVIASGTTVTSSDIDKIRARKKLKLPLGKTLLLCFGVNHREKSYSTVFKALKLLPTNVLDNLSVLFAGRIDHSLVENDPVVLARRYNLHDNVKVYDRFIPETEVELFFSASDFVLLSYSQQFTCSSMVLAQAFQFMVPVIASKIGQLGDQVVKYGVGIPFEPESPSSLCLTLQSVVFLGQDKINEMKHNLNLLARKFSWENTAKAHIDLYENLLHYPRREI